MTVHPDGRAVLALVCGRLVAALTGSNPAEGMDVCILCFYVVLTCVGRVLCVGLIKSSSTVCIVCDQETPEQRMTRLNVGCSAIGGK
jgi:hypothetical protein